MHFNLLELTIRKNMYGIGILNLYIMPRESGTRHLLLIRMDRYLDGWHLLVHGLFCLNWKIF